MFSSGFEPPPKYVSPDYHTQPITAFPDVNPPKKTIPMSICEFSWPKPKNHQLNINQPLKF